jgi:hypothetical protein
MCLIRGLETKKAKHRKEKDETTVCLRFLNYLASFLWPSADRAVSILPWVVSRGRSYGCLWADLIIRLYKERLSYFVEVASISDRSAPTAIAEFNGHEEHKHRCPKLANPNFQETCLIEQLRNKGCAISTQETTAQK